MTKGNMTQKPHFQVFIGFDPREAAAFAVCRESIRRFDRHLVINGLVLSDLQISGLYTRPTAVANPAYFLTVLFGWAHRLAFLMLPITTILLSVLYAGTRRIYVHDHVMVASNLLSFSLLTNGFGLILPGGLGPVWFTFLAFWTPVNMFQTLRGAYGSSRVGALLKTSILWPGSILTFGVLALALLALTLTQL